MTHRPDKEPDVEILELGAVHRDTPTEGGEPHGTGGAAAGRRGPARRVWLPLGLVVLLLIGIALVRGDAGGSARAQGSSAGSATSAPGASGTAGGAAGGARGGASGGTAPSPPSWVTASRSLSVSPSDQVQVTRVGHPLLPGTIDWSLFGYSPEGALIRVDPGIGRVVRTPVPPASTEGPLDLIIGSRAVLIRPWDGTGTVLVPDGRLPQGVTGFLDQALPGSTMPGGPVVPGPDRDHVWAPSADGSAMVLRALDGSESGRRLPLAPGLSPFAGDGTGQVVLSGVGGAYLAEGRTVRRITAGALMAIGPTRWLVQECDDSYRCRVLVIDRADGQRHVLTAWNTTQFYWTAGSISPEGSFAALPPQDGNDPQLLLTNLDTGRSRVLPSPVNWTYPASIAWSPDGRWLLVPTSPEENVVIDVCTGRGRDLGVRLPNLVAVGVRPDDPAARHGRLVCPSS